MDKSFRLAPLSCVLIAAVGCSSQQMQSFKSTVNDIGKDYGMPVLCGAGMIAGGAAGYALNGEKGAVAGLAIGGYRENEKQPLRQGLARLFGR